jgi:TusA-related sulfurtransferase
VLAKAIAQISEKKQLLITTQDEIFANEIKAACAWAKAYDIKSWDERGPIM